MKYIFLVGMIWYACVKSNGQPLLLQPIQQAGLTLYPDLILKNRYYYVAGQLMLAVKPDGKPEFKLMMTRYTGSHITNNYGLTKFNNVLQFKIKLKYVEPSVLQQLRRSLSADRNVELIPLQIKNIQSSLTYQEINPAGVNGDTISVGNGAFETIQDQGAVQTTWTERYYTIRMSNEQAQLLANTLEKGQTFFGFTYDFETDGVSVKFDQQRLEVQNMEESKVNEIRDKFKVDTVITPLVNYKIVSDAFEIRVMAGEYKDLVHKIDLNAVRIPADYAALEIRCYDFNQGIRTDLGAKRIEIEATGVSLTTTVRQRFTFSALQPDIYVKTIQFPYAVRTDKPFRYRVVEVSKTEMNPKISEWKEQKEWFSLLDVTSQ
jgi:hypothetical protein